MKKTLAGIILIALFFTACNKSEHEADVVDVQILQRELGYSMEIPSDWLGKYNVQKIDENTDYIFHNDLQALSRDIQANYWADGRLFAISRYEPNLEPEWIDSAWKLGYNGGYNYYFSTPSEDWLEESFYFSDSYTTMNGDIPAIRDSIKLEAFEEVDIDINSKEVRELFAATQQRQAFMAFWEEYTDLNMLSHQTYNELISVMAFLGEHNFNKTHSIDKSRKIVSEFLSVGEFDEKSQLNSLKFNLEQGTVDSVVGVYPKSEIDKYARQLFGL